MGVSLYISRVVLETLGVDDFGIYNDDVVIMWSQVKASTNMTPVYIFLSVTVVLLAIGLTAYVVRKKIVTNYKKKLVKY